MLSVLFFMNLLMSLIFMTMSHPLSMGMILLIQTLIISLMTGNFSINYWFSYILFLILVGSMLILFIYMTSIASNEKFKIKMSNLKIWITLLTTLIVMFLLIKLSMNINMFNNDLISSIKTAAISTSMIKYLNFPSKLILLFMIMYLLLTLIVVVKITDFKYGPLRLKN